jgi:hypothetical protein
MQQNKDNDEWYYVINIPLVRPVFLKRSIFNQSCVGRSDSSIRPKLLLLPTARIFRLSLCSAVPEFFQMEIKREVVVCCAAGGGHTHGPNLSDNHSTV